MCIRDREYMSLCLFFKFLSSGNRKKDGFSVGGASMDQKQLTGQNISDGAESKDHIGAGGDGSGSGRERDVYKRQPLCYSQFF